MVGARAHDDHRAAAGLRGVLRELAGDPGRRRAGTPVIASCQAGVYGVDGVVVPARPLTGQLRRGPRRTARASGRTPWSPGARRRDAPAPRGGVAAARRRVVEARQVTSTTALAVVVAATARGRRRSRSRFHRPAPVSPNRWPSDPLGTTGCAGPASSSTGLNSAFSVALAVTEQVGGGEELAGRVATLPVRGASSSTHEVGQVGVLPHVVVEVRRRSRRRRTPGGRRAPSPWPGHRRCRARRPATRRRTSRCRRSRARPPRPSGRGSGPRPSSGRRVCASPARSSPTSSGSRRPTSRRTPARRSGRRRPAARRPAGRRTSRRTTASSRRSGR